LKPTQIYLQEHENSYLYNIFSIFPFSYIKHHQEFTSVKPKRSIHTNKTEGKGLKIKERKELPSCQSSMDSPQRMLFHSFDSHLCSLSLSSFLARV
jgi:hypothetical protein